MKKKKGKEKKSFFKKKFFDLWLKYEAAKRHPGYLDESRVYFGAQVIKNKFQNIPDLDLKKKLFNKIDELVEEPKALLEKKYPHLFSINPFSWEDNEHNLLDCKREILPGYDMPTVLSVLREDFRDTGILRGIQINLKYPLNIIIELLKETISKYQNQFFKKHPECRIKGAYLTKPEKIFRNFEIYDEVEKLRRNSKWKNKNEEFSSAMKKEERNYKSYFRTPKYSIIAKKFNLTKQTAWEAYCWAYKEIFGIPYKKNKSMLSAKANTYSLNENILGIQNTNLDYLDISEETIGTITDEAKNLREKGKSPVEIMSILKEKYKEYPLIKEILDPLINSLSKC